MASPKDACKSQVLVLGPPPSSSCFLSILDQDQTSIYLRAVRLPADMAGGVRTRENFSTDSRRKLLSGNKEEEKAHCDWQMTQELRDT